MNYAYSSYYPNVYLTISDSTHLPFDGMDNALLDAENFYYIKLNDIIVNGKKSDGYGTCDMIYIDYGVYFSATNIKFYDMVSGTTNNFILIKLKLKI